MQRIHPFAKTSATLGTALALSLTFAAGAAQAADPYAGVSASADARYYALVCGTCNVDTGQVFLGSNGGTGAGSAFVEGAGAGWAVTARGDLTGPVSLPDLGAYAFADIVVDPSIPKTYFYKSAANVAAVQRYDYSGSVAATYTLQYTLEGTFFLAGNDAASLMFATGGFTVYGSNYNPVGEFQGTVLGFDYDTERPSLAGSTPFGHSASVSFTLNPGDAFYVVARLTAYADSSHQVVGTVDALNTLALNFTGGDTTLLVPSVVPEPAPATSLALGLGLLLFAVRRMRAAALPESGA